VHVHVEERQVFLEGVDPARTGSRLVRLGHGSTSMRHADITDPIVAVTHCADKPALGRDAYLISCR